MKKNMGNTDRAIRMLLAGIIVILFSVNIISGPLAYALLIVAGIFVFTSLFGSCPLYSLFRINTCQRKEA
jgi:hypothetical protein